MMFLGWLCVFIALVGTVLNVRRNRWGFALWIVSNTGLVAINVAIGQWPQAALFLIYTWLALWGFVAWGRK